MRLPAYLLLPMVGAAVLIAAVLGAWLWPEPTVSAPSETSPAVMAPVAAEAPPPPPSTPRSLPSRASPPVQPAKPPPSPVAMPTEPTPVPSVEPVASPNSQLTNLSPEQQREVKNKFLTLGQRTGELAERGARELERQREMARARGDEAEVNRLDELLRVYQERMERTRQQRLELAPEAQAGPPVQ